MGFRSSYIHQKQHEKMTKSRDPICYDRNFLTEVLVRMDFGNEMEALNNLDKRVHESALKDFPIPNPQDFHESQILVSKENLKRSKNKKFTDHIYDGANREKQLKINPKRIVIIHYQFNQFENLVTEFSQIINSLFECLPEIYGKRLGLRYINEFNIKDLESPLSWEGLIQKKLIEMLKFPNKSLSQHLSRSFNNMEFNFDDYNTRFQYGIFNPDYPSKVKKNQFIMDFDSYSNKSLDIQDIPDQLNTLHSSIQDLFEDSITDEMRKILNGKA